MRIRSDLFGVVYAHLGDGVVRLTAGDPVPEGAQVGEHLADADSPADAGLAAGDPVPEGAQVGDDLTSADSQDDSGREGDDAGSGHRRRRVRTPRQTTDG
jgi:hypothetical protein